MSLLPVDIQVYATSFVEVIDNASPADLKAAVQWLDEKAEDHAERASHRRLYRALAKLVREASR